MSDRAEFEKAALQAGHDPVWDGDQYLYEDVQTAWEIWQAARAQSGQGVEQIVATLEHTEPEPVGFIPSSGLNNLEAGHPAKIYPMNAMPSPFESRALVYPQPAQQGSVPEFDLPQGYSVRFDPETGWHWYDDVADCTSNELFDSPFSAAIGVWRRYSTMRTTFQRTAGKMLLEAAATIDSDGRYAEKPGYRVFDDVRNCILGALEYINQLPAATPQPEGQKASVPDGWKLVPVEPTTEMRYAYHEAEQRYLEGSIPSPDGQWWAMLDAAPQPPQEG